MRCCLLGNDGYLSDGDYELLRYVPAHVRPLRFGGGKEFKPVPTGTPLIVHPPPIRLDGFDNPSLGFNPPQDDRVRLGHEA